VSARRNILVVYHYAQEVPARASVSEHLFAFSRHTPHRVVHVNLAMRGLPRDVAAAPFDAIVLHTTALSTRWHRPTFERTFEQLLPLAAHPAVKIALPQDEFISVDLLGSALEALKVDRVFSVAPESEWPTIYPGVDRRRARFRQVLTGYLDDGAIARAKALRARNGARPIDVGYRAWRATPALGRHGILKARIADVFAEAAPRHGLRVDISTRQEDTIFGEAWYEFLRRCRWQIGVEGGASVLDRDGAVRDRVNAYVAAHPSASFDEIEAACFPGLEGTLRLFALSPRHLECCLTETAQLLVEGAYNGVLRPEAHYLPVRPDLSNVDEVLERAKDERLRQELTARAWDDIVASGKYTYAAFARGVLDDALADRPAAAAYRGWDLLWTREQAAELAAWGRLAARPYLAKVPAPRLPDAPTLVQRALDLLPGPAARLLRAARGALRDHDGRVVTITPVAVEKDSRTFKQSASFARWGLDAMVVEGIPSARLSGRGEPPPFRLESLSARWDRMASNGLVTSVGSAVHALGAPGRFARHVREWYAGYFAQRVLVPFLALPKASLYYVHAPEYFLAVRLRCLLHGSEYIYDAHDFYGRIRNPEEVPFTDRVAVLPFLRWVERACARQAAAVITVSPALAAEMSRAFGVPVHTVRNVQDPRLEAPVRQGIREALGLASDDALLVTVGQAKQGQAVSALLEALATLPPNVHVAFLGAGHDDKRAAVRAAGLEGRVHLLGPVLPDEVVPFIRSADASLILYYSRSINYHYCLPNGLFQSLSAGLPTLHPDLPEISEVARRWPFGLVIDPQDATSLRGAIERLLGDPALRARLRAGAVEAGRELTWENEEGVLRRLVDPLTRA
jgi:glycosyltransferase involved in cell wall biosynthesis